MIAQKNIIGYVIIALISTLFASQSYAEQGGKERFELFFYDQQLKGQHTLYLKQELKRQYGYIKPKNYRLRKAILFAKTKQGRGKAALRVGDYYSDYKVVGGTPFNFHSGFGYQRIKLRNNNHHSSGVWQIHLKGNFKVEKVILVVEKVNHYRHAQSTKHNLTQQTYAGNSRQHQNFFKSVDFRTHKSGSKKSHLTVGRAINRVKVYGYKRKSKIHEVIVVYRNGESHRLHQLEGRIHSGEVKEMSLPRNRYVKHIFFKYSPGREDKRGYFSVSV